MENTQTLTKSKMLNIWYFSVYSNSCRNVQKTRICWLFSMNCRKSCAVIVIMHYRWQRCTIWKDANGWGKKLIRMRTRLLTAS